MSGLGAPLVKLRLVLKLILVLNVMVDDPVGPHGVSSLVILWHVQTWPLLLKLNCLCYCVTLVGEGKYRYN